MTGVSTIRLYMLRAVYLLIAVGLALMIWPGIISHPVDVEHMRGVMVGFVTVERDIAGAAEADDQLARFC